MPILCDDVISIGVNNNNPNRKCMVKMKHRITVGTCYHILSPPTNPDTVQVMFLTFPSLSFNSKDSSSCRIHLLSARPSLLLSSQKPHTIQKPHFLAEVDLVLPFVFARLDKSGLGNCHLAYLLLQY